MKYEIRIHPNNAESIFNKVDIETKERLKEKIRVLEDSPKKNRAGADIKKLKNANPEAYRLRIGGYRVIYSVENNTVWITEIFQRGRNYRKQ
jgi:mRNA interferase RelE/StbE